MKKQLSEQLVQEMSDGFAHHQIICDSAGTPVDYRFLSVNPAFETLTGLKAAEITGKTVREIFPDLEPFWIETFGKVALTGEKTHFEHFSKPLGRYFDVRAYQSEPGHFACLFTDITESKQIRESLSESEALLARVQEIAGIGSWKLDLTTNHLTWSAQVYRIFGFTPQSFGATYEAFLEAVHPDDRAAVDSAYSDSLRDGNDHYEIEHRIVRHDTGEICHVHERCIHERDATGKIICSVGMVQDITVRKQAERLLEENKNRLENILDTCAEWIWQIDLSGRHTYSNSAIETILGYSPEELIGRSFSDFLHEDDLLAVSETLPELIRDKRGWQGWVLRWRHKDGTLRWLESNAKPVIAGGQLVGFSGADRDITARKQAEEALQRSEEKLHNIVTLLPQGIYEADLHGTFTYANRAAFELFGYSEADLAAGMNVIDTIVPEDVGRMKENIGRLLKGLETENSEYTARRKDGTTFPVAIYSSVVKKGANPVGLRGVLVDITKRKSYELVLRQALENAERANRTKDEFLSNISHELRTPISAIFGFAELMEETSLTKQQHHYLETINSSAKTLLALVNDLLDIAKIESGRLELKAEAFNLEEVVGQCIDSQILPATAKGLTIRTRVADEIPNRLLGDQLRLRQILLNLLSNAVKFTHEGEVVLSVTAENQQAATILLHFALSDTGVGIKAENIAHIFEPFRQIDASLSRKFGGVGLGLAICSQLATLMGGDIEVESREGVGSTFHLRIPFALDDADTKSDDSRPANQAAFWQGKPLRVLVAEDYAVTQTYLHEVLTRHGHHADITGNGRDAISMWQRGHYDLILMDVQMPLMDGIAAVREIRRTEQERGGHIPIIALTAHAMEEDRLDFLSKGFDGYVAKPMRMEDLFREMQRCLDEG